MVQQWERWFRHHFNFNFPENGFRQTKKKSFSLRHLFDERPPNSGYTMEGSTDFLPLSFEYIKRESGRMNSDGCIAQPVEKRRSPGRWVYWLGVTMDTSPPFLSQQLRLSRIVLVFLLFLIARIDFFLFYCTITKVWKFQDFESTDYRSQEEYKSHLYFTIDFMFHKK